jgi:hypothetical protein
MMRDHEESQRYDGVSNIFGQPKRFNAGTGSFLLESLRTRVNASAMSVVILAGHRGQPSPGQSYFSASRSFRDED